MKSKIINGIITIFCFGIVLSSCEEEERGPLVKDSTIPGTVTEVSVANLPGGARISYKVPDDDDAFFVEAAFTRNGKQVTARSSIYKSFVEIDGLKSGQVQDVELVTVDRSDNRSAAVKVTIEPLIAPIDILFGSFELVEDFGGVRLKYDNKENVKAELLLYTKGENGNLIYQQSAFIDSDEKSFHIYRGFPIELNTFGVVAIDRWDNVTDTIKADILPLLEVELDKGNFKKLNFPSDEPPAWGTSIEGLWDNNYTVWNRGLHTTANINGPAVPPYEQYWQMFSIDLGVTAKLSRFKFFQRVNSFEYRHGNPKRFELWGITELPGNDGTSLERWVRLVENGEVVKPSRLPLGQLSSEDIAEAADGEEYILPIDAPPIRYIRFVTLESWSGGTFMHINELEFFGQIEE
ncbi:MAG: DUF4959 domain-containing protein [Cytophagales bacterium]|nr:DUF4959 domain-containing protein [Cytophagales bacterium]